MQARTPSTFPQNVDVALRDKELSRALRAASDSFATKRRTSVDAVPDWEELRERASSIKKHTLDHLDQYLDTFTTKAEEAGAIVHWATDANHACEIIGEIVQPGDEVVKSKSMTTEEIELNESLQRRGTTPTETDLGEWIIQLAGEPPSHIIAPAIHKTKEQVADLFAEKLGIAPTTDIMELTAVARRALRKRFKAASVGISGVNFAIAETGSILIVENEGNARLTTSLPNVHIAVMGMEKVIPRLQDLDTFLRILPRSGTGQTLTSYQSLLTGPEKDQAKDGPRELHIVVLDNGRMNMLAHPTTRYALSCIRCGACLNVCPVYQQIGGHAYGAVYAGPIGSVVTPQLQGLDTAHHLPFASSLCGACRDVCPVKIDIPKALVHLRTMYVSGTPSTTDARTRRFAARAWKWIMSSGGRYRSAARALRILQHVPFWQLLPGVRNWSKGRAQPSLAKQSFREWWSTSGNLPDSDRNNG